MMMTFLHAVGDDDDGRILSHGHGESSSPEEAHEICNQDIRCAKSGNCNTNRQSVKKSVTTLGC